MFDFEVYDVPSHNFAAVIADASIPMRENKAVTPQPIGDSGHCYIPWGADNQLPFHIIDQFERDETLSACESFVAETLYASGIDYEPEDEMSRSEIDSFQIDNDIQSYFLGSCGDIKKFDFAVSRIILSADGSKIVSVSRLEACYCRFAQADESGNIPFVYYADWRLPVTSMADVSVIRCISSGPLLKNMRSLALDGVRDFAVVSKMPGADAMYYPVPAYTSIFRGSWYRIKRLIGVAKESKLRNSAPLKYLVEISSRYWEEVFRAAHVVEAAAKQELKNKLKKEMIDFLTGAENSGKAIFSNFYVDPTGKEVHDIRITKIEDEKEGGDWASDHAEAINMICFAMRVHSNLVGSVPGKAQTNNSGSDKRELYTIAQALQTPYRRCALFLHRVIIAFNGWNASVSAPLLQLTTTDEHRDIKKSDTP